MSKHMRVSLKQIAMLRDYHRDGEASDLDDFDGAMGWHNRERVINALHRKGLLNEDGLTECGLNVLRAAGEVL